MPRAYVGLGANLGDRQRMLQRAVALLGDSSGIDVIAVSTFRETDPVGVVDQPRFVNGAVAVDTTSGFNFKPAVRLFETSHLRNNQPPSYDVTADGRFVVLKPQTTAAEPITVVFNWTATQSSTTHRGN